MKMLVCGAGPLGSLFAARLHQGGHDVTLLARGQRLADLGILAGAALAGWLIRGRRMKGSRRA